GPDAQPRPAADAEAAEATVAAEAAALKNEARAKDVRRVFRLLLKDGRRLVPTDGQIGFEACFTISETGGDGPKTTCSHEGVVPGHWVADWHVRGFIIRCTLDGGFRLAEAGRRHLRRLMSQVDATEDTASPEMGRGSSQAHEGGQPKSVAPTSGVDRKPDRDAERSEASPLAIRRLARIKDHKGEKLLAQADCSAAERLARDYEVGRMMPRVTSSWGRGAGCGSRSTWQPDELTLSERGLEARERFRAALSAVGPDAASVLIDVCCHDLGLGDLEAKRALPRRSGKVVLQLALRSLARHYGYR
ncbi:MAG: DUF6456 domain-containing protein, partial [Pseudomonadota bacterium]